MDPVGSSALSLEGPSIKSRLGWSPGYGQQHSWLWPYEFLGQPWPHILATYREVTEGDSSLEHLMAIVESIMASPANKLLAGRISSHVHELNVAEVPIGDPPIETIIVRTPRSLHHRCAPGTVAIEHSSSTGRDDRIERPAW